MSKTVERTTRNFINNYGRQRFIRLLTLFAEGTNGQKIANEFQVSRERVRQWKNTFGTVIVNYKLHPHVQRTVQQIEDSARTTQPSPIFPFFGR